jgi:putative transcriptional regulator
LNAVIFFSLISFKNQTMREVNDLDRNLLRFIRQSKGLTQPQFAQLLGVSHAYVSYLETGSKPMTANIRNKVRGLVGDEYIERCRQFIGSISR